MDAPPTKNLPNDIMQRLERRAERERNARIAAEKLLEQKSRELYLANQQLKSLAAGLEQRVEERTRELVDAREQAVKLAERDHLTGLANRTCFVRVLCEAIERWHEGNRRFALLLIDLDRFKEINDTVGHDAGDAFLQHAASHIKRSVRGHDVVARLGGDEFAVICNFVESARDVVCVAERIMGEFEKPLHYRNRILSASCSIGFAVFPDDASNVTDLQRFADIALYRSKAGGRAAFTAFSPTMSEEVHQRQTLERALRLAVKDGSIEPWYQPILEAATGVPVAAEVLARWRLPDGSVLPPAAFISVLEECSLMRDLFRGVLRTSCTTARTWIEQGHIEYLSVNVSPSQFKMGSLLGDVESILAETGFPYEALQLEITEDALLADLQAVSAQLGELTARGVRIALDDFGSGYSSIGYLRHLPIHAIKLDRSLTCDVVSDVRARAIVGAVNEIAKALGVGLLAEGVETESQALLLGRAGCRYLQGYLFGRPAPAPEFENWFSAASAAAARQAQWG
jgi:diguanylate cyclase (GGDEF)-like protein